MGNYRPISRKKFFNSFITIWKSILFSLNSSLVFALFFRLSRRWFKCATIGMRENWQVSCFLIFVRPSTQSIIRFYQRKFSFMESLIENWCGSSLISLWSSPRLYSWPSSVFSFINDLPDSLRIHYPLFICWRYSNLYL